MSAFEDEAKNSLEGKIMNTYFQTDKSDLTKNDSIDIKNYLMKADSLEGGLKTLVVGGFADYRGDKNDVLSFNRAKAVADYIFKLYPEIKISLFAFGESQSTESNDSLVLQKDRVVKIIPNIILIKGFKPMLTNPTISFAETMLAKPITNPTERSMPPVIITNNSPIPIKKIAVVKKKIIWIPSILKNPSTNKLKITLKSWNIKNGEKRATSIARTLYLTAPK